MSDLTHAMRSLLAFTLRADRQMLMSLVAVSSEDLTRETGSGYSTVLGTMGHVLGMERVWLSRFMGNPVEYWDQYPDFESLREGFHEFWSECEFFVASLSNDQLTSEVVFRDFDDVVKSLPLFQVVLSFAQHACHHRGQVATMLRQLGYEPPAIDMSMHSGG